MIAYDPETMPPPRCCWCGDPMYNIIGGTGLNPIIFYGQCPRCDGVVESVPVLKNSLRKPLTHSAPQT